MRIISCLVTQHNLFVVLLAAVMCLVGASVTMNLFRRAAGELGVQRSAWAFLIAVCAGSTIWATHFIAMLAYESSAPVSFDLVLTLVSILVAIVGTGAGLSLASSSSRRSALIGGGGLTGLSIAGMHFLGMSAYRVEGIVVWDFSYIVASVVIAVVFSTAAVFAAKRWETGWVRHAGTALLVVGIVGLHFTAMAAFSVTPLSIAPAAVNSGLFLAMAFAILLVSLFVVGTCISCNIIDDRTRAISDQQSHMARHDLLTGLTNRRALLERLDGLFADRRSFHFLAIDLDHFKAVNDSFGHAVGDKLLVEVAVRLTEVCRAGDFPTRIGGDEMCLVVCGDREAARTIAMELNRLIAAPIHVDGHRLMIGCSIGICSSDDAKDADDLIKHADAALYESKRRGRGSLFFYERNMAEETEQRRLLLADLQKALANGEFHLVFQPLFDLKNGCTIGREALLRWEHPVRGPVLPAEFIPMAEQDGCIVAVGNWVLAAACRQASLWDPSINVAVNVSAVQLASPLLLGHVTRALAESGLPASRLEIQLTETAVVADATAVTHVLSSLRILGVKIALDGFGTGYSSLSHIRNLPLDRVKIDRSFVSSASFDKNAYAVVRAVTTMCRDMGIATLGEGVETDEQLQILRELGCDAVQGYLMGRPERLDESSPAGHAEVPTFSRNGSVGSAWALQG